MRPFSMLAIYVLMWVMCAFVVLPFGVRTPDELGVEKVPGQAHSAPANFRPRVIVLRTTLLSLAVFVLFFANYRYGWIVPADLDISPLIGLK
ncbi:DUF1467 family protein [Novosphingobium sp. FKTRR1]|uniref:DUF1467 family protein n=1 Tax=unclassified Novosphingobium TaxID=2644732 RepID=UPI001CF0D466|nr:DUF1467 family protein [Novosphingobium sp. FKTRR1]